MAEREQIEDYRQKYLSLRENTPDMYRDGEECKAYRKWYESAYVYFKSFDSLKNDPDLDTFTNAQKDGNCFVLEHVYDSISPSYKVLMIKTENLDNTDNKNQNAKTPMVFVSHSHYDKDVAEALVDLLENIGFDSSNLFCSSVDGYGIGLSEDIFETLRTLFNQHNLYVIFIHSPRYYKSAVSLNEMGAAWVLRTDFCSILTPDIDFNELEGVVDSSTISIKVDNADAPARLTQLKDKLTQVFGLKGIDSIKWERKRNAFLKRVQEIKYLEKTKSEVNYKRFLSDEEFQVLKEWVNSGNQFSSQRYLIGDRILYHLGNRDYESIGAEKNAEWEDFFERLNTHGFITISEIDKSGYPKYKLKKAAFDYVRTNSKE